MAEWFEDEEFWKELYPYLFSQKVFQQAEKQVGNEWIIIKGQRARTFRFDLTVYSGQELKERLERAGFTGIKLYGSFDGASYGSDAKRLIAKARRP